MDTYTVWVCTDCIQHAANGECGGCDGDLYTHDRPPLDLLDGMEVSCGMIQDEHECGREDDSNFDECDCEVTAFSWSRCEGCGSTLGGERHAMTVWQREQEPV